MYARINNNGFTDWPGWSPPADHKEIVVGDRIYWVEPKGSTDNRYLTQLTGLTITGTAYTLISDEKDLKRLKKHYESVAHDNGWDICRGCDERIEGTGAMSRVDGVTVCSNCGVTEARNALFETVLESRDCKIGQTVMNDINETGLLAYELIKSREAAGIEQITTADQELAKIWVDSIADHQAVIPLLFAYFRENANPNFEEDGEINALWDYAFIVGAHYALRRLNAINDEAETP